jgi:hypothetical protein
MNGRANGPGIEVTGLPITYNSVKNTSVKIKMVVILVKVKTEAEYKFVQEESITDPKIVSDISMFESFDHE